MINNTIESERFECVLIDWFDMGVVIVFVVVNQPNLSTIENG